MLGSLILAFVVLSSGSSHDADASLGANLQLSTRGLFCKPRKIGQSCTWGCGCAKGLWCRFWKCVRSYKTSRTSKCSERKRAGIFSLLVYPSDKFIRFPRKPRGHFYASYLGKRFKFKRSLTDIGSSVQVGKKDPRVSGVRGCKRPKFTTYSRDDSCNVYDVSVNKGRDVFVSFRGSKSFCDMRRVGDTRPVRMKGIPRGRVYAGMWRMLEGSLTPLCAILRSVLKAKHRRNVVFTGHSAGGSIAELAQILLPKNCLSSWRRKSSKHSIRFISFMPAKVGTPAFVMQYKRYGGKSNVRFNTWTKCGRAYTYDPASAGPPWFSHPPSRLYHIKCPKKKNGRDRYCSGCHSKALDWGAAWKGV